MSGLTKKYYHNIDLDQNQLLNAVMDNVTATGSASGDGGVLNLKFGATRSVQGLGYISLFGDTGKFGFLDYTASGTRTAIFSLTNQAYNANITYTLPGTAGTLALTSDLSSYQLTSAKGVANGYASLDGTGRVPSGQLPSYVDDVLEYTNLAGFPATGETGKIYVALDTNKIYRWSGSAYIEIQASAGTTDSLTEGTTNLYFTNARARAAISLTTTGSSGSAAYSNSTGVLNIPTYTLSGLGGQPLATNLTSLSSLSYASASFVKMTAAGTFSLDTSTYLTSAVSTINFGTTGLTPSSATSGAVTVAGTLVGANGGTGQSTYAIGDLLQGGATNTLTKLAAVATGNALISGGVTTASSWGKIGLTTHISGTLAVGNGGTGATTLTGVLIGNGTSAVTAVAGTASQILRRNAGDTAYEFFTLTSLNNPMTTLGDIIYGGASGAATRLAGNTTATKNVLTSTGSGGVATAPVWGTLTATDVGAQASSTNLTSLAALSYVSASFVKMTASGTFSLDTNTYLTANQSISLSGDISGTGTTAITTAIGANKVTNAMLAQVATSTFKGRVTAATGNVEDLTGTQATTLLDVFSSTLKGLVPLSGGGTTNFLRADGTWAAPAGGSGITDGDKGDITVSSSGTVWTIDNSVVTVAKISATGTPSSSTYLRGDGSWSTVSGGAYTVTNQTTTYNATATSGTLIVKCDTSGGAFTVNLPTAVGNTATIIIKKTAGSAAVTVDGNTTETIDGGLTATINKVYESITLISDNANWQIV